MKMSSFSYSESFDLKSLLSILKITLKWYVKIKNEEKHTMLKVKFSNLQ